MSQNNPPNHNAPKMGTRAWVEAAPDEGRFWARLFYAYATNWGKKPRRWVTRK